MYKINSNKDDILVSHASKFSKASSYFFLSGFIIAKAQYLPLALVAAALNLISLTLYLIGYSLWAIGSLFHPEHTKHEKEWYGFSQFKEQYLYAALLGLIASIIGMCAVFVPVLLIPAAWIIFASNIIWATGEYHKLNNPPTYDKNYSESYQRSALNYAIAVSAIGLTAAISTTIAVLFPAVALSMIILSAIICAGFATLAAEYWLDYTFGNHPKTVFTESSYKKMQQPLGPSLSQELSNTPDPTIHQELLPRHSKKTVEPSSPDETTTSIHTCTPN